MRSHLTLLSCSILFSPILALPAFAEDPHLWLEEVDGERALDWVKARNAESEALITTDPSFEVQRQRILEILDDTRRIPFPNFRGDAVDNFWQDQEHVRGIWRRTSFDSYLTESPEWRTILDLDALGKAEDESWVWGGATCLEPEERFCMVRLSRGGGDAVVLREIDSATGEFVKDGFFVPEGKTNIAWRDRDTLLISGDFGPGTLTDSGYARTVRVWTRGTNLADAPTVFEGLQSDVAVSPGVTHLGGRRYEILSRAPSFFTQEHFLVLGDRLVRLDLPGDIQLRGIFDDHLLLSGRAPWTSGGIELPAGALVALPLDGLLRGRPTPEVLFTPSERVSLDGVSTSANRVLVSVLDNVKGKLHAFRRGADGWSSEVIDLPATGTVGVVATDSERTAFFATYTDFLNPSNLMLVEVSDTGNKLSKVRSQPAFFDATGLVVE